MFPPVVYIAHHEPSARVPAVYVDKVVSMIESPSSIVLLFAADFGFVVDIVVSPAMQHR